MKHDPQDVAFLKSLTVLYVEDDADTREQLSPFLRHRTGTLLTAQDGLEGLELFRQCRPHIVITDIQMPLLDGLEIRDLDPNVPIVIATAFEQVDYLLRSIEVGVDQFVGKPIDSRRLEVVLLACARRLRGEQQQRLAAEVFDSSLEAIVITDAGNRIVSVNRAFTRLTGYRAEEVLGETPKLLASGRHDQDFYRRMWDSIRTTGSWQGEICNRRKNGEVYPENLTITTLVDRQGGITNYIAMFSDITERKAAEERLLAAKNAAEVANRAKSAFLATMSHELRTPLNASIGFSDLLLSKIPGPLNAEQEEYLGYVLQSNTNLLGLINDILDLSKLEANKMDLELGAVEIEPILESSATIVKELAYQRGVQLEWGVDADTPQCISADQRKLKQVLYGLLSNAVKFTPAGGRVVVRASRADAGDRRIPEDIRRQLTGGRWQGSGCLLVSVTDSGIGLEKDDLERIFNHFEQVSNTAAREYEGTGLGLGLARKLLELMGGVIWAESPGPDKGSTFRFVLPA